MTSVNYGNNTYIFWKYDPFNEMKKIHDSCRIFFKNRKHYVRLQLSVPELGKILEVLVLEYDFRRTRTRSFFKILNEYSYMKTI